jgi:TPR repeat protein
MKPAIIVVVLAASVVAFAATGSRASPLEDGTAAFERGDYAAAEASLLPLAEQGDPSAEGVVGLIFAMGLLPNHDPKVGVEWLRKAAAGDDPVAEYALGQASLDGRFGAPHDEQAAVLWLRKAAVHADPMKSADAQLALARLYATGRGVTASQEEAQTWYNKARAGFEVMAGRGLLRADLTLASMYSQGEGVQKDQVRAAQLYKAVALEYERAAEQGLPSMQSKLAGLYRRGLGVPADGAQAYIWFRRAADQGDLGAMIQLGQIYMTLGLPAVLGGAGNSDPENAIQSCVWLRLAAIHAPPSMAMQLKPTTDTAMRDLTAEQRARVDTIVKDWLPVKEAPGAYGSGPATIAQKAELDRLKAAATVAEAAHQ